MSQTGPTDHEYDPRNANIARDPPPDELIPLVYEELRSLARSRLARLGSGQTLQATALVHEAYVRLRGKTAANWDDPHRFFLAAAGAMRDILVERARAKSSAKRGGGRQRLNLETLVLAQEAPPREMLALSDALSELQQVDKLKHEIVLLRFFAGCTEDEVSEAMKLPLRTIQREWRFARSWLLKRLSDETSA